jgi:hypothetical protein
MRKESSEREPRASLESDGRLGSNFSRKMLTKVDDLSEDSRPPSAVHTSRSQKKDMQPNPEPTFQANGPLPNSLKFEQVCSIPLTNLIGKFLRELVANGKSFSLELILDDTPDGAAQIASLLQESRFAYKYGDRFALRAQEEHIKAEYQALKQSLFQRQMQGARTHQRLVVEDYQKIPDSKREEIEQLLSRSRLRDSYRVLDGKTYSDTASLPLTPNKQAPILFPSDSGTVPGLTVFKQLQASLCSPDGHRPTNDSLHSGGRPN